MTATIAPATSSSRDEDVQVEPNAPLTETQRLVFNWMIRYTIEHFYQPTLREVMTEFGWASANGVLCHLRGLRDKGLIRLPDHDRYGLERSTGGGVKGQRSRAIEFLRRTPIED